MIETIIGKKGTGKTTLAKHLFNCRKYHFGVIVDPLNQFSDYPFVDFKNILHTDLFLPVRAVITDTDDFKELCRLLPYKANLTLLVDEIDMFDSAKLCLVNFMRLINYSRHYHIDIITTSRRPANISKNLTSQTDIFYVFKMTEPADLKYFKSINPQIIKLLPTLKEYEFVKYSDTQKVMVHLPISIPTSDN